jgi:hypothetical protein
METMEIWVSRDLQMAEWAQKSMCEVQARLDSVVEQTRELRSYSFSALARWEEGWNTIKGGV